MITSTAGILALLAGIASLFFFLEAKTKWKGFNFFPPLIFIYLTPVLFTNTSVIPAQSPLYDFMGSTILPVFLILMLLEVDLMATVRVMGKGLLVMLAGTVGVIIGAPLAVMVVKGGLGPEMWKGFGTLAGSWIGGTGNMLAVAQMIDLDDSTVAYTYAVIADNAVYLIWLPIMLASKNMAKAFNKFMSVSKDRLEKIEQAAKELTSDKGPIEMRHILYLTMIGFGGAALASVISTQIPALPPYLSANTYKILLVTIIGISLSFTKASRIPGSNQLAMALIYLFVARMGAKADLSGLTSSVFWFLLGAYIWIFIHGAVLLIAAKIFKVDVHTAAIASAANIGGAASAPIVAAYHRPALVPVSIMMAMVGYAIGNPAGWLTAQLCRLVW